MACPENSRRVEDARHPDLGTDHFPAAPEVAATTQSDLEDLPAQSPGSDGFHGLFTVPTITMKVLFVFLVLEHRRREVLHFNVMEHPCAAWTSSRSSRPSLTRMGPSICSEIETVSTAVRFVCESPHSR